MAVRKKATKKKAVKKKATKKKAGAKKTTKAKKKTTGKRATKGTDAKKRSGASKSITAGRKPLTKSQMINLIAESRGLTRKEILGVFEDIESIIAAELKKHKKFSLAGLVKFTEKKKPAKKARKGTNPFTGEEMMFKAKPASKTVKAVSLKKLKDMV